MSRPQPTDSYDEVFVDSEPSEPDDEADENYAPFSTAKLLRRSSKRHSKPIAKGRKSDGRRVAREETRSEPKHAQRERSTSDSHPSIPQGPSTLYSQTYLESILRQASKGEAYPPHPPALQLNAANYDDEAAVQSDMYDCRPSLQINTAEPIIRSAPVSSIPSSSSNPLLSNQSLYALQDGQSARVPVHHPMETTWGQAWPQLGTQAVGARSNPLSVDLAAESLKRLTSLPSRSMFQPSKKVKEDTSPSEASQSGGVNPNDLKLPSGSSPLDGPGSTGSMVDHSVMPGSQASVGSVFSSHPPVLAEEALQRPRLSLPLLSRDPSSETAVTQSDDDCFDMQQRHQPFAFYNSSASLQQFSQLQNALLSKPVHPLSSVTSTNFAFDFRPSTANSYTSFGPSEASSLAGPEYAASPMASMPLHHATGQHYSPYGVVSQSMSGRPATSHGPYMMPSFSHQMDHYAPSFAAPLPSWIQPRVQQQAPSPHMSRPQTSLPLSSTVSGADWRQRLGKRRSQTLPPEPTAIPGSGTYSDMYGTPSMFQAPFPIGERRMSYPGFGGGAKYGQGLGWAPDILSTSFMSPASAPAQTPGQSLSSAFDNRSQSLSQQQATILHPPPFAPPSHIKRGHRRPVPGSNQQTAYPPSSQPSVKQDQPRSLSFSQPKIPTSAQLDTRRRSMGSGPTPKSALARAVFFDGPEITETEVAVSETEREDDEGESDQNDDAEYEEKSGHVSSSSEDEPLRLSSRTSRASNSKAKSKATYSFCKRNRSSKSRSKSTSNESRPKTPMDMSETHSQMVCACPLMHMARPADGDNAEPHLCTTKVTANRLLVQGHKLCSYCIGRDGHVEEYVKERIRTKTVDRLCFIYVIYRELKIDQTHGDGQRWQKYWEHHRREQVDEEYGKKMMASWIERMETEKRNWEKHQERAAQRAAQAAKASESTRAAKAKADDEDKMDSMEKEVKARAKSRSIASSLEPDPADFASIPEPKSVSDSDSSTSCDDWAPNPHSHSSTSLAIPKRPIKRGQIKSKAQPHRPTHRSVSTPDPAIKDSTTKVNILNSSSPDSRIPASPLKDKFWSMRSAAGLAGVADVEKWDGRVSLSLTPPPVEERVESKEVRDWDVDEAVWRALSSSPRD
ncbi:hypothetical protein L202_03388 [Cryptococcus amylolentus CBS 6039]|uniref:Uncharacterized protein n=1 Tax=Cryptococcus amylolentus CBS 6039 TaxID=1295533 RepID=A0A1E3HSS2_9TREE|nr:hypothetical protein L202_03388 [Cryptococcus amylolentus CBS 6039]ODN79387.1 hypothetical protein L202_03388 [Cryptococcus amylolentus CBS 6039]